MELIDVGGVELAHRTDGAEGPWITLVHGGLVASYSWRFQLPGDAGPGLVEAGRVLCYDQRGYGESSRPDGGHDIAGFAGDLLRLWDELGIERTIVVGFSLGGFVALQAAVRAPHRVAGLVLESCGVVSTAAQQLFSDRADAMDAGRFDDEVALHVRRAFSAGFAEANEDDLAHYTDLARRAEPAALAETFRSIAAWTLPDEAASLTCPKLMINGAEDPGFGPAAGAALAAQLSDTRHVVIPGAGHTAHYERAAVFNQAVAELVAAAPTEEPTT
jgi:pimeloyl-ACP methyl ester carboxylesterase